MSARPGLVRPWERGGASPSATLQYVTVLHHQSKQTRIITAQNIRVLQKNLVYAVGLAAEICDEELLKGSQYFGQFGKIIKVGCRCARNFAMHSHLNVHRFLSTAPRQLLLASRRPAAVHTSRTNARRMPSAASRAWMTSFGWVCENASTYALTPLWGTGRHVRVCYGTTKYCNAFLKGLPCNNQDCLYLHDIGALPHSCALRTLYPRLHS